MKKKHKQRQSIELESAKFRQKNVIDKSVMGRIYASPLSEWKLYVTLTVTYDRLDRPKILCDARFVYVCTPLN